MASPQFPQTWTLLGPLHDQALKNLGWALVLSLLESTSRGAQQKWRASKKNSPSSFVTPGSSGKLAQHLVGIREFTPLPNELASPFAAVRMPRCRGISSSLQPSANAYSLPPSAPASAHRRRPQPLRELAGAQQCHCCAYSRGHLDSTPLLTILAKKCLYHFCAAFDI